MQGIPTHKLFPYSNKKHLNPHQEVQLGHFRFNSYPCKTTLRLKRETKKKQQGTLW